MTERELAFTPAMVPMFVRAGAALVPGAARLPFVPGGGGQAPALTLVRSGCGGGPRPARGV